MIHKLFFLTPWLISKFEHLTPSSFITSSTKKDALLKDVMTYSIANTIFYS